MKKGIMLLILATILWGGNYICGRILGPALPATLLNTIRWAISTIILWGLMSLKKKRFPIISRWKELFLLGFFGIFAFSTLNYLSLRSLSASYAGMISAGIPIAILLFTPIILKEHISAKSWAGAVVSIAGVILLVLGKHTAVSGSSLIGIIEILLSCLAWGIYTVLGKRYGSKMDPLTMTAGASFYGTILSALSCIGTVDTSMIHLDASAWLAILYVSTLASVVAFFAWGAGVEIVGPALAAPFINLLPVSTVVLGVLFLNESLSGITMAGGLITIIGAVLATYQRPGKKSLRHRTE
ncbi:DMT family transporter [Neobacillus mesonae]|uniref:DMT family transporter n=1 Tax=Neobacillus mesonae TaxID=1193713 RepID=UPI00203F29E2|nr:DMT family transporter [Neobacillus mesonae]MCM3567657.1 DMT family transporter [Neobacillus mesonae]